MKLSVIVPAHNEEHVIENTLNSVSKVLNRYHLDYEIIAVDDNSDDSTFSIIKNTSKFNKKIKPLHKISRKKGPTGFGSALIFGFKYAKGDVLIPFMGDLSDDPRDIPKLVKEIENGYDVVCGSRFVKGGKVFGYPLIKLIAHRIYNKLFSFLFGLKLNDFTNAFKVYRKNIFDSIRIESKGFEFDAEVLLKAHILGFKITEIPVKWRKRKEGMSKLGSFSPTFGFIFLKLPSVGWKYGKIAMKLYMKYLLSKFIKFNKL